MNARIVVTARAKGTPYPPLDTSLPFDPQTWIEDYRATGGNVYNIGGKALQTSYPGYDATQADMDRHHELLKIAMFGERENQIFNALPETPITLPWRRNRPPRSSSRLRGQHSS